MLTSGLKWSLGLAAITLLTGWLAMENYFGEQERRVSAAQAGKGRERQNQFQAEKERKQRQWQAELQRLKDAGEREAHERATRFNNEVVRAFGGPVQMAVKNPSLTIEEMLGQTARACAPRETDVEVQVDRFTEFEARVTFPPGTDQSQAAGFLDCFVEQCGTYLDSVRIRAIPELDWLIDRQAIRSIVAREASVRDVISRADAPRAKQLD